LSAQVPDQLRKWRTWIDHDIRHNVVGMYFRRQMWRDVNEILLANPTVGQQPSAFWDFYQESYAAAQAVAIRSQADDRRDTCSLRRLLGEIAARPDLLSRRGYAELLDAQQAQDELLVQHANRDWDAWADSQGERFNGAIARADVDGLQRAAGRVSVYVNEHLAHDAAAPKVTELPTFNDLHEAIDSIGALFQKYATILTGGSWELDHIVLGDWREIFRTAWIPD
jgi:hypothetical protein